MSIEYVTKKLFETVVEKHTLARMECDELLSENKCNIQRIHEMTESMRDMVNILDNVQPLFNPEVGYDTVEYFNCIMHRVASAKKIAEQFIKG